MSGFDCAAVPPLAMSAPDAHERNRILRRNSQRRMLRISLASISISLLVWGLWVTDCFNIERLAGGLAKLTTITLLMWPPVPKDSAADILLALGQSISMAFLATAIATALALPLGFVASRNVTRSHVNRLLLRRSFDFLRGIDSLIWGLVFVSAVGLGPFAGVLALVVADVGTLSKLFAEAVENTDRAQREGVESVGASRIQLVRFALWPQVAPVMLSNILYRLESNIRSASVLGAVGAGGIGLQLFEQLRANNWREVGFIVLIVAGTVWMVSVMSSRIRTRLS
ncbi:phosphonate transport system permease protein [Bradyrhizobium sp. USDA 336]